ncbi:DUF4232 domain-containing protein [Streptomyces johnsoniae]|uniref:DUF4232 domain-containing protein n=1 Tax=Streptomyces johnsoniae TaxID=3075532 RepID=A0ABU2S3G0_9ACTN|nr:DUF4232 domain-containing protein [Streptomyces sp. DSM 41886]MDT0443502.1 DUF4232 domain-containing protein [Streptomyces sp. DSM 41886]
MTTNAPHRRTRLLAAAALGATLALTLTACQDEEADASGGSASQSPGTESPQEAGGDGTAGEHGDVAEGTAPPATGGGTPEDGAGESGQEASACTPDTTELTAAPVERPINHMLLTATNTGDATCVAYHAPFLRLGDDAQAAVPRNEDSKPQSVITLAPGQTAYAAVLTSSAAMEAAGGYTATSLGVQFADAEDAAIEGMADVPLPGGDVYVDDSAQVSYWQSSLNDALTW